MDITIMLNIRERRFEVQFPPQDAFFVTTFYCDQQLPRIDMGKLLNLSLQKNLMGTENMPNVY